MRTSSPASIASKGHFIKFNLDGTINTLSVIENDSLGIDMWQGYNLIETLDHNFACFVIADTSGTKGGFMFIKLTPYGDTLITKFFHGFFSGVVHFHDLQHLVDTGRKFFGVHQR